jgi:Bacterial SH3 domain/N-acetylmuramoyl-L-alanine amidase
MGTWRGRDEALEITTIEDLRAYIRSGDYSNWKPSGWVIHNTAAPTLEQWWHGDTPPAQRMENMKYYYEVENGWSAGPHCFIDGKSWWVMTDFWVSGVHSPSYNGTRLGFEMVGDYDTESDESGMGAKVMEMTVALSGEICKFFGWEPNNTTCKFHYEDPETDHACPGDNIHKPEFLQDTNQYMGEGGDDHDRPYVRPRVGRVDNIEEGDTLNIRAAPSSSSEIIGEAENGDKLNVVSEVYNGSTQWLRIQVGVSAGAKVALFGWVNGAYVNMRVGDIGPHGLPPPMDEEMQDAIAEIAERSEIAGYSWRDHGKAPAGYIKGVALAYANTYRQWRLGYAPAYDMALGTSNDPDTDALAWFADDFKQLGMDNVFAGPDTLRHLWMVILGLGVRESSGEHCTGRDQNAENTTADTCEAGAWQTSYNAHNCSNHFDTLFEAFYEGRNNDNPQGFLKVFSEGVSCSESDWDCYGERESEGYIHQEMSKHLPAYAAEVCAITLRHNRSHYGPVNRREVEIRADADTMFKAVQDYVDRAEPEEPRRDDVRR